MESGTILPGKVEARRTKTIQSSLTRLDRIQKINGPDMIFGPANLWSLTPASFIYRKKNDKGLI